ncbi:MAG: DUF1552 domain-containing protein [Polyangiales bacterium]
MNLNRSRRRFLRSIGLVAAATALPFRKGILQAQPQAIPKRFAALKYCNGISPENWFPTDSSLDFKLAEPTRFLAPFESVKDQLLVFRNISILASRGPAGSHTAGMVTFLTGSEDLSDEGRAFGDISIDQYIAENHPIPSAVQSIQLVVAGGGRDRGAISYRAPSQRLVPDPNPINTYTRLFGSLDSVQTDESLARDLANNKSVLDFVATDLSNLKNALGTNDRERLDSHLESIRSVETELEAIHAAGVCEGPARPVLTDVLNDPVNIPTISRLNMDMIATAFACQRTHVATHAWASGAGAISFPFLTYQGVPIDDQIHYLSHYGNDAERKEKHALGLLWHYQQMAYLLERLAALPDDDGQSILDHSVVMIGTENGRAPAHSIAQIPFMTAGSANGFFRTGRCVTFSEGPNGEGRAHNDLLITLTHAFDAPRTTFGDKKYCSGPLEGLT